MSVDRKSRIGLRVVALGYLAVLLLVPVALVFYRTFEQGIGAFFESITTPAAIHALFLTLEVAAHHGAAQRRLRRARGDRARARALPRQARCSTR